MQVTPHATRTVPLCKDCSHAKAIGTSTTAYCGHPSAPVDPVKGLPELRAELMRGRAGTRMVPRDVNLCGPEGTLFAQRLGDGVRPAPTDWPFGELTQEQRLTRAKQEARMRANALRGLPSCFGGLS